MENPFKARDQVITKVKGVEVLATVIQTWKREVQVKTSGGDLLWRTMHTVRLADELTPIKPRRSNASKKREKPSSPPTATARKTAKPRRGRKRR